MNKRMLVLAALVILGAGSLAQADDRCRRQTTRYYTDRASNNRCGQNYNRNYTDYTRRNYGSSYRQPTTVCSPVVSYSYRPEPVVYYVRRPVCRPIFVIHLEIDD